MTTSLDEPRHDTPRIPRRHELFLMLAVFLGLLIGVASMVMLALTPRT